MKLKSLFILFLNVSIVLAIIYLGCNQKSPIENNNQSESIITDSVSPFLKISPPDSVPDEIADIAFQRVLKLQGNGWHMLLAKLHDSKIKYYVTYMNSLEGSVDILEESFITKEGNIEQLTQIEKKHIAKVLLKNNLYKATTAIVCFRLATFYSNANYGGHYFQFSQGCYATPGYYGYTVPDLRSSRGVCYGWNYAGTLNDCISSHSWETDERDYWDAGVLKTVWAIPKKIKQWQHPNRGGYQFFHENGQQGAHPNYADLRWDPGWPRPTINDAVSYLECHYQVVNTEP